MLVGCWSTLEPLKRLWTDRMLTSPLLAILSLAPPSSRIEIGAQEHPPCFLVQNAGMKEVNGLYVASWLEGYAGPTACDRAYSNRPVSLL